MPTEYPTTFQKKVCWYALTALAALLIFSALGVVIYAVTRVVSFLQPVLIPVAIAGILAYLLDPVASFFCRRGASRTVATLIVFLGFFLLASGVLVSVIPTAYRQGATFIQNFPTYTKQAQELGIKTIQSLEDLQKKPWFGEVPDGGELGVVTEAADTALKNLVAAAQEQLPNVLFQIGNFLQRSIGGFLGAFGLIIGLILVPVFLFYMLRDAPEIARHWSEFLPLRTSPLKSEIVSLLVEINGYIIAFFRGQILVGIIDGALIAAALLIIGVDFAILIGIMVATLGIIPYAGTILTWGPAVLIAAAQYGDWLHPLLVTGVFLAVNQLDSLFISPWIVGDSVGLHPLTVMISVLLWTVILGGLIGALLAVPLTAALKVVASRYFWDRPKRAEDAKQVPRSGSAPPGIVGG